MKFDLTKYKAFRNLPEKYKSDKFLKLYTKIYNYTLSISREKIVQKTIVERNGYLAYLLNVINIFLEVKDFYHWKDRIYRLLTEKISSKTFTHYKLLYGSKAKEYYRKTQKSYKNTYNSKSKEELDNITNKRKSTCKEKYNTESYSQTNEYKVKYKSTCLERYGSKNPAQSKEVQDKMKATLLKNYNVTCAFQLSKQNGSHSKSGDEICLAIDNALGNPKDSKYATKNEEFSLKTIDNSIRYYDYCIPSLMLIVEIDNLYWHALDKNPDDIVKYPGGKLVLAKEIHERDKEKEKLAIQNGYKVFHIRDDEYYKDPKGTIEKLIEEIKKVLEILGPY